MYIPTLYSYEALILKTLILLKFRTFAITIYKKYGTSG